MSPAGDEVADAEGRDGGVEGVAPDAGDDAADQEHQADRDDLVGVGELDGGVDRVEEVFHNLEAETDHRSEDDDGQDGAELCPGDHDEQDHAEDLEGLLVDGASQSGAPVGGELRADQLRRE